MKPELGPRFGYIRYSLSSVEKVEQLHRLEALRCKRFVIEHTAPAPYQTHHSLHALIQEMLPGSVLVATSLDRIVQSVDELMMLLADLDERQLKLELVNYPGGHEQTVGASNAIPLLALADLEKNIRSERRRLGIEKAKQRGKYKGRKASFDQKRAVELYERGEHVEALAERFNVTTRTIYRALEKGKL